VERFPSLESSSCDPTNQCSLLWVWKFHFISIPFMAGSAFVLIAVLLALVPRTPTMENR
jgi:disulfide bond formation protein DsbB